MEKTFSKKSIAFCSILIMLCLLAVVAFAGCGTTKYTVKIASNNTEYGSVSVTEIKDVKADSVIVINGNKLTIGDTEVTATPASATSTYTFAFSGWSVANGDKITKDTTITATFTRSTNPANTYSVAEIKSALSTINTNAENGNLKNFAGILNSKITTFTEDVAFTITDDVTFPEGREITLIINSNTTNKTIEILGSMTDMQGAGSGTWQAMYHRILINLDTNKAVSTAGINIFIQATESNLTYGILQSSETYNATTNETNILQPNTYTSNYVNAGNPGAAMAVLEEQEYNNIVAKFA